MKTALVILAAVSPYRSISISYLSSLFHPILFPAFTARPVKWARCKTKFCNAPEVKTTTRFYLMNKLLATMDVSISPKGVILASPNSIV